jgi:Spy/CpxP family protein refolding chaperone
MLSGMAARRQSGEETMNTRGFLTVLLATTLASTGAHAQDQVPAAGPRLERIARELDLTDAQRAKMRDAAERQKRRGIQERADIQVAALDLHKLVRADKPDQHAIDAQVDKLAGMRARLQKERIATRLEMRSMLTDVQRAKLRELQATRKIHGRPGPHRMPEHEIPDGGGPPTDD